MGNRVTLAELRAKRVSSQGGSPGCGPGCPPRSTTASPSRGAATTPGTRSGFAAAGSASRGEREAHCDARRYAGEPTNVGSSPVRSQAKVAAISASRSCGRCPPVSSSMTNAVGR